MIDSTFVMRCFGITKDSETNDFMMVMGYANNGSLRHYLNHSFNSIKWEKKLDILRKIAESLNIIHVNRLVHRDFHCGNILKTGVNTFITDLGLCQPANVNLSQNENKNIYG